LIKFGSLGNVKIFHRYKVREVFAGGGSALVEWRLETGRTHQVIICGYHLDCKEQLGKYSLKHGCSLIFIADLAPADYQIRAHAKYLGIPLLGDETYGGTKSMALSLLRPRTKSKYHIGLSDLISKVDRPCLHAALLG
jgi:tRNA pseudouridine synthase 2